MRCRKVSVGVFELITSFILRSSQNVIGGLQMKKYIPQMIMLLLTFFGFMVVLYLLYLIGSGLLGSV